MMVNAKANVTPEMLLFLARKVEKYPASILDSVVWLAYPLDTWMQYRPHTDDAQFGRLVVWAAQHDCVTAVYPQEAAAWLYENNPSGCSHNMRHDSAPDSIRAAAVVAIARSLGFQEVANAHRP